MHARTLSSSSLSACEAAILSLWDNETTDVEEIARRTGYAPAYVRQVVSRYNISGPVLNGFDRMTILGSQALLAAIRRHHPERVPFGSAQDRPSTGLRAGSGGAR